MQRYIVHRSTTALRLLRCNDLASHELGGGVGEVRHVAHDGVHRGLVFSGLLEVRHAAPLEGGLDGVGSVGRELENLRCVSDTRYERKVWTS
jgi:hypothetical protein